MERSALSVGRVGGVLLVRRLAQLATTTTTSTPPGVPTEVAFSAAQLALGGRGGALMAAALAGPGARKDAVGFAPEVRRGVDALLIDTLERAVKERQLPEAAAGTAAAAAARRRLHERLDPAADGEAARAAWRAAELGERVADLRAGRAGAWDPEHAALVERQIEHETLAVERATRRYRKGVADAARRGEGSTLPAARKLMLRWFEPLSDAIRKEQEAVRNNVPGVDRRVYGPYLLLLKPDKLAVIALHSVISNLMRGEVMWRAGHGPSESGLSKMIKVTHYIGDNVQTQVEFSRVNAHAGRRPRQSFERRAGSDQEREAAVEAILRGGVGALELEEEEEEEDLVAMCRDEEEFLRDEGLHALYVRRKGQDKVRVSRHTSTALNADEWGSDVRTKVGAVLLDLVLRTATISVPLFDGSGKMHDVPAFLTRYLYRPHRNMRYGVVAWRDEVAMQLQDDQLVREAWYPKHMPMLVKPRPWTAHNRGGYLQSNSCIIRGGFSRSGPSTAQMDELRGGPGVRDDTFFRTYSRVLDAMNVLGETPWRINVPVLRVIEALWEQGGDVADLPARQDAPLPPPPGSRFGLGRYGGAMFAHRRVQRNEERTYKNSKFWVTRANRESYSQRCDLMYKLAVARELEHEKCFYFPHNLDFRGRAYPMHPHLNHLANDVCRGLLKFAEAKPLGERGLEWLLIQVANLYAVGGVDKLPMPERAQWTREHLDQVIESAENPVDGERWWTHAEDPWQCLAACFELRDAMNSGDPASFVSHLPVHQDGSCNGLQHYAALGRDRVGGAAVNLMPADRPADVYTGISKLVAEAVEEEAKGTGTSAELAAELLPHIDRKLVKQTVMTSVYGVTYVGARQQVQNRLKERGAWENDERKRYVMACYAARKTLTGLDNMFTNARAVMAWLADCAKVVAASGETVRWTTPLGLPVVQPYVGRGKRVVRTVLQSFLTQSEVPGSKVMRSKQRSAFPPNYIHSIDSSHMMLTALGCSEAGITFAGVHDSYWTHAGTVEQMNEILRDKFVELHSEPLLENLHRDLCERYPGLADQFEKPPQLGELELEDVRKSVYFFS